ncbi:MAG: hypothetical protein A2287_10485 [Candidatus Melainabacteria bacterium RIFOXYA12_FULL_32_12]|nr:MAG: hypothetical protein A2255_09460 [Candidatus Melainabacteria bacterium RIFOXYA2_FULL_32_9]OGI28327.1 MAG: hypothetical protein A2287_10485 [Candidatus Melainabacteria bacterium RIFOXYA12_FULL_32_12]
MIEGRFKDLNISLSGNDVSLVLKLARQSHENYLIRSLEKDLESAVLYYLEAIKLDPSIPEAYCKLASLLWEKGQIDVDSALDECRKAMKIDPNSSVARLYAGNFLKAAGRFEEAEKEFLEAIKINKFFSAKPRIALGVNIIQKMQTSASNINELARGLYYFCSGIVMILWDYNSLRMLCRSIIEDIKLLSIKFNVNLFKKLKKYDQAIRIYEDAAERTGKITMFYSEIGDLSLEIGDYSKAVQYYKKTLESSPDNVVIWAKLTNLLQTQYKDNVDELKSCYNRLVELEPNNARIYYELGHLYLKLEDRFSAINAFRRSVEIEPSNAFYHNSLAYGLVQLEDYNGAISEYQKAIKLNPDNEWTSIVTQALGAIYHQVKCNIDAAVVAYQTAVVLDPYNVDAFIALGELYHETNDLNNAIDCYCEVIKLDPSIPKVYCNFGLALWEKDYIEEAIVAFQKAVTLDPKYSVALNNLGVVCLDGAGKPDEALINFTRAIKCNPNYAAAYYNKGRAYQVLDNKMSAAKYYQMAIDINKFTNELNEPEVEERLYELFAVK